MWHSDDTSSLLHLSQTTRVRGEKNRSRSFGRLSLGGVFMLDFSFCRIYLCLIKVYLNGKVSYYFITCKGSGSG